MDQLLSGRWQAYKFAIKGTDTWYAKGTGLKFTIHPDGKVDYSHHWKGEWTSDTIERSVKEDIIIAEGKPQYLVQNLTDKEVEFAVIENYGKPKLIFFLRRMP